MLTSRRNLPPPAPLPKTSIILRDVIPHLHNICDLHPLTLGGVSACRVVCTGMEQEDGMFRSTLGKKETEQNGCGQTAWSVKSDRFQNGSGQDIRLTSRSPRKPARSSPRFSASQYLYGRTSLNPASAKTAL